MNSEIVNTDITNHKLEDEYNGLVKESQKQDLALSTKQSKMAELIDLKAVGEERLNKLNEDIENLDNELTDIQKDIKQKKQNYEEMIKKEFKLRSGLSNEKLRLANYNKEIKEKQGGIEEISKEVFDIKEEQEKVKVRLKELEIEFNERKSEHVGLTAELNKLIELKNELSSLSNDYLTKNTKSTVEIRRIKTELTYYEENNNKLKKEAAEIENGLKNTKSKRNNLENEFNELKKKVKSFITKVNTTNKNSEIGFNLLNDIYTHINNLQLFIASVESCFNGNVDKKKVNDENEILKNGIVELNKMFFLKKQEMKMIDNENNILKEMQKKLDKDFDLFKENIEVLDDQNEEKPKEHYLELIYDEIKNLTKVRYPKEDFIIQNKKVIDEILAIIDKECQNKVKVLINGIEMENNKETSFVVSTDNQELISNVDLELEDNTSLNASNLYNKVNEEAYYTSNNNSKANPNIRNILRNSKSARLYDLSEFKPNDSSVSSKRELIKKASVKHFYRDDYNDDDNELKEAWSGIINGFVDLLNYFLKSSSLLANLVSIMLSKANRYNDNSHKVKSIIIK